jgi:hypothetical protein
MANINAYTQDLIAQFDGALKKYPDSVDGSIGFVRRNLQPKHVEAALWLQANHGMAMDAYNLHDLILNFDRFKAIAGSFAVVASVGLLASGRFNPMHLVEYFQLMRGLAKSEVQ